MTLHKPCTPKPNLQTLCKGVPSLLSYQQDYLLSMKH
nr:MAG TPA: hypothetical protein [Caudoviricetes sp.]